jgi:hypothetical protein
MAGHRTPSAHLARQRRGGHTFPRSSRASDPRVHHFERYSALGELLLVLDDLRQYHNDV